MAVAQAELPLRQCNRLLLHAVQESGGEQPGPVGARLAMGQHRIVQLVGHVQQAQHPVLPRRTPGIEPEVDMGDAQGPADGNFLAIGGVRMLTAQIDDCSEAMPAGPAAQLCRRRLARAEQARRDAIEAVMHQPEHRMVAKKRICRRAQGRCGRSGRAIRRAGAQEPAGPRPPPAPPCRLATKRA